MYEKYRQTGAGVLVPDNKIICKGQYFCELIRGGKLIDSWTVDNLVVNEGLNANLGVMFNAATQITAWFLGVFEGNYTPVATDTAAGIAAAATESTAYASATRPAWTQASPASQSITNSASRASFVFNATKTIYGAFMVSSSTKLGTAGTLFSAARFGTAKAVVNLDELLLTYTFTASSV